MRSMGKSQCCPPVRQAWREIGWDRLPLGETHRAHMPPRGQQLRTPVLLRNAAAVAGHSSDNQHGWDIGLIDGIEPAQVSRTSGRAVVPESALHPDRAR